MTMLWASVGKYGREAFEVSARAGFLLGVTCPCVGRRAQRSGRVRLPSAPV